MHFEMQLVTRLQDIADKLETVEIERQVEVKEARMKLDHNMR